jgi:hypothetical protein
MMRNALSAVIALLLLSTAAHAQRRRAPYGLPAGALVVEEIQLELRDGKRRALVLWMLRPKKYPRGDEEFYTCPEETRGSFYRGRTRVSLVEAAAGRVVNTLKVVQEYSHGEDEFDLPYRIHAGSHYHVPGVAEGREGRPEIMRLRDFNGDGRALEFALFDALACMGLETALFGYSERQDRVVQYPVRLESEYGGKRTTESLNWVDYLFGREQTGPGRWKFEVDYRGRGGTLDSYEVGYNAEAERFEGTVTRVSGQ